MLLYKDSKCILSFRQESGLDGTKGALYTQSMAKTKTATKIVRSTKKAKKGGEDREEARARHTAETVMQAVLAESKVEAETVRLDQWVPIECPHCGEGT